MCDTTPIGFDLALTLGTINEVSITAVMNNHVTLLNDFRKDTEYNELQNLQ